VKLYVSRQKGNFWMGKDIPPNDGSYVLFRPFRSLRQAANETAPHHRIFRLVEVKRPRKATKGKGK
jgi:hypothetical protein